MAGNEVEKLEKKMGSKIEEVRDMMLDRFCGVDQKLTAIEELLRKIMEAQNQVGDARVKDTCKGAVEFSKSQNKENKMLIGGDDGGRLREYGTSNPFGWVGLYTNPYVKDNPGGPDFGMGRDLCATTWVGQPESSFRQKNRPYEGTKTQSGRGTNGFEQKVVKYEETESEHNGKNILKTGQDDVFKDRPYEGTRTQSGRETNGSEQKVVKNEETGWSRKKSEHNGENIVKTGQDEVFKDSSKGTKKSCVTSSGSWDKLADKTNVSLKDFAKSDLWDKKDSHSWAKLADKTNVSLQDSAKPDPWGKKDSRSWAKEVDNERNGNYGSMEFDKGREKVEEGSNWDEKVNGQTNANGGWGKADHQHQAQGSGGWKKNDDWGPKRKRSISPTGGPNDGPRYSGPLTATKQRLDIFTSDEQEIVTEIDPIMISIKRILNQEGYNDGDPLTADDQTCIIDHVFNHHPDKDKKMGAGIDYVMVAKHKNFPDSRCFYVVSTDGRKEDFSYIKCLQNFVTRKYPDKGDEFISKYFNKPRPRHRPLQYMDNGSVHGETGRPSFQSGWKREPVVAAYGAGTRNQSWHHTRVTHVGQAETKQDLDWRQRVAPRWGS